MLILILAALTQEGLEKGFENLTRDRAADILRVDFYSAGYPAGNPHPAVVVQTDVLHPGRYEIEVALGAPDGAVFVNVVGFDAPAPGVYISEHNYPDLVIYDPTGWTVNGVLREVPVQEVYVVASGGGGGGCAARTPAAPGAILAFLLAVGATAKLARRAA